ncbi:Bacteriophage lysis protein [compost metagenome]
MSSAYSYAAALLIGFGAAWYVRGLRWDSDVAAIRHTADQALVVNVDAVNQQLIASRAQTEEIRKVFLDYKTGKENETSALERDVADGIKRLRVKATCAPAVPATGTVPGGTGEGTAELEHTARSDYFALRREADRQYGELQFCRSELRKRSAK